MKQTGWSRRTTGPARYRRMAIVGGLLLGVGFGFWALGFLAFLPIDAGVDRAMFVGLWLAVVSGLGVTFGLIKAHRLFAGRGIAITFLTYVALSFPLCSGLLLTLNGLVPRGDTQYAVRVLTKREVRTESTERSTYQKQIDVASWHEPAKSITLREGNHFAAELWYAINQGDRLTMSTRRGLFGWEYVLDIVRAEEPGKMRTK